MDEPPPLPHAAAPQPALDSPGPSPAGRRHLWIETGVVLALAVVPDIFNATNHLWLEDDRSLGFRYTAGSLIVRAIQVAVPVLYIMWRSGDGWPHFGIRRFRPIIDPLCGVGVWAASMAAYYAYAWGLYFLLPELYQPLQGGFDGSRAFGSPSGPVDTALAAFASAANAFGEEIVIAGFLVPRLGALLGGPARAVAASALLFASYHAYQGAFNAIEVFVMGLVTCSIFALTRRLWPNVIAHGFADLVGFLSL